MRSSAPSWGSGRPDSENRNVASLFDASGFRKAEIDLGSAFILHRKVHTVLLMSKMVSFLTKSMTTGMAGGLGKAPKMSQRYKHEAQASEFPHPTSQH